ncbi:MAG TPA: WD40 repeat domain-containing protein, partial [Saprospiraceae bacterium]|nr:WD40 repeat domain-containing protein [Saprospiraceae bacterium]
MNNTWQLKKKYEPVSDLRAVAFYLGDEAMLVASGRKVTVRSTANSRTIVQTFDDMPADILSMSYSSDGKIACALSNFVIRVWPGTDQNQYFDLRGHTDKVLSVQFSRNSRLLISGGADHNAILWDAETGALVRTFERHTGEVRSASFFDDDDKIITAGNDHYVYLWDRNGALLQTLLCGPEFNGIALGPPDKKHVLTGDLDLRFWPISWSVFNDNSPHIAEITSLSVAPGDELCLTGSKDHTAKIWNIESQDVLWTFQAEDEVVAVDWSLDGNYFMIGLRNGTIHLFDSDRLLISTFRGQHSSSLTCLALSPDGKHYISGSRDGLAKVWELNGSNNPTLVSTLTDRSDVSSVAWSPNGLMIAIGFLNENVKIYPWDKPKPLNSRPITLRDSVNCLRFSPDNKSLLVCGSYGAAQLFTLKGHSVQSFDLASDDVSVMACDFSSYGNRIALATRVGKVKIFALMNNEWVKKSYAKALPGRITCVRWLKNKGQILVAGEDGRIRLLDEEMKTLKVYRGHTGDIQYGVMAAKRTFFITAGADQTVKFWNKNNRELLSHPVKGPITAIALHAPNGRTVLAGVTENKKGKLYRFTFGKSEVVDTLIYTFQGNIQAISCLFKGDSSRFAAGDNRGNIRVLDRHYKALREKQFKSPLTTLTFSPKSGRLLAVGVTS